LTVNELLALLGRAWPRLLIYPGGLVAFAVVWLLVGTKNKERRTSQPTTDDLRKAQPESQFSILHSQFPIPSSWLDLSAVVLPWLGLALLPLPHAAAIGRQTDLIAGLALLEWPLLLTIAVELRGCGAAPQHVHRRLASALNSYPPLILATLVLVSAAGSLDLATLARAPTETTPAHVAVLHWLGAAAWLLALPPALGLGAFAAHTLSARTLHVGLGLRAVGLVAIAALPWFPLVATSDENVSITADARWLLLPLPPLVIAGLLWGFARLTAGRPARSWARAYLALDVALLLALLWTAYTALQARLA
jgi:hypothetical protein